MYIQTDNSFILHPRNSYILYIENLLSRFHGLMTLLTCNVGPSRSPTTLTSALAESSTTSGGNSNDHRTFSSSEKSERKMCKLTTGQFNHIIDLLKCFGLFRITTVKI
jgi:hypothetical protein